MKASESLKSCRLIEYFSLFFILINKELGCESVVVKVLTLFPRELEIIWKNIISEFGHSLENQHFGRCQMRAIESLKSCRLKDYFSLFFIQIKKVSEIKLLAFEFYLFIDCFWQILPQIYILVSSINLFFSKCYFWVNWPKFKQ